MQIKFVAQKKSLITLSNPTATGDKLRAMVTPLLKVASKHSSRSAKNVTVEAAGGLPQYVFLAQHAKVMPTRNLWSDVGLMNGIPVGLLILFGTQDKELWPFRNSPWCTLKGTTGQCDLLRAHRCT